MKCTNHRGKIVMYVLYCMCIYCCMYWFSLQYLMLYLYTDLYFEPLSGFKGEGVIALTSNHGRELAAMLICNCIFD